MHDFTKELFIEYAGGKSITATRHFVGEQEVFRIAFSDKRPPLLVRLVMHTADQSKDYWTSMPSGRTKEAQAIGRLLEPFLMK